VITGEKMHKWAADLFNINRSITGPGVRETLVFLSNLIKGLQIKNVASGTKVFDWTVPDEWEIREAFIEDKYGNRIVDFKNNNLHIVGYSVAVDQYMELDELQKYLHSLPEQSDAIPYVTSYYSKSWGFCLTHNQRESLESGKYRVYIDSTISPGVLNYGELIIPGDSKEEVLLSTYICHPSMANNELSGPVVTAALSQWLLSLKKRRYTYRIIFIPETIGSITYISKNLDYMKENVIAGFVITCIGDNRTYSFLPSRKGGTLTDRAALHCLKNSVKKFNEYSYLDRGSDERQYCSPGVDLPVCSIMRSKYDTYPEYHTSLDNLSFISPEGLKGGYDILKKTIRIIEVNDYYKNIFYCEPQLGKRGLYPNLSIKGSSADDLKNLMNLLAYADGEIDLIDLANIINVDIIDLHPIVEKLIDSELIEKVC
jgi:aminopeptidase-like protein